MSTLLLAALALTALQDDPAGPEPTPPEPRGLVLATDEAAPGYTLYAPLRSSTTYLVDRDGAVVHRWPSEHPPGNAVYLQDDGSLLRCARVTDSDRFHGGGQGGRIQRITWGGDVTWDYRFADDERFHHHDIEPLPNGNVLVVAWEYRSPEEAVAAGRDPEHVSPAEGFWPDALFEVEPVPPDGGRVVWEWHAWDHLVQDFDPEGANWGSPADRPERVDVNADHRDEPPLTAAERERRAELERQMRAIGYVGDDDEEDEEEDGDDAPPRRIRGDWMHTNSVDYHAGLDLVVISVRSLHEIWVVDHSTTTAEARGSTGGRYGRGGDLLYRWGNPRHYGAGTRADQRLFGQHDASFVDGPGGALHVLVYNNGEGRPDGAFSSVDEIALPFDLEDGFARTPGAAFGPAEPFWRYTAPDPEDFFSSFISGAERLPNGHTLVCEGATGRLFEVTPDGRTVWEYLNPHGGDAPLGSGPRPAPGGRPAPREATPPAGGAAPAGGGRRRIPYGLFRAARIAPDHPGLSGRELRAEKKL